MKSKTTKRERLEGAKATLRDSFAAVPVEIQARPDAKEILASAWQQATLISEFAAKFFRHYMLDEKTGAFIPPAKFHQEIYELLLTEQAAAVAAPREHAKSTIVSLIFVLYAICYKLRRFIVLISDTQPQARLLLGAVKAELEENEKLHEDFGDLVPQGDGAKWAEEDIVTITGIRVSARGAGQSLRGLRQRAARPDLVIIDDIDNDEAVENPDSRAKLMSWFKRAVLNLGKNCQFLVVGTILHHDSLLSNLLDPKKFKRFVKRVYEAVDDLWTPESILWPERWPLEALKEKSEDIGIGDFDQEFRNKPVSKVDQKFKDEWFEAHYFTMEEIKDEVLNVVTVFDPAIRLKQKNDLFATATIGVNKAGTIFVLRAEGTRIPFNEQLQRVFAVYSADRPAQVGIETIAYQEALKQEVERVGKEQHLFIPVVELNPHTDKDMRIDATAPLIENGTIRFRRDQQDAVRMFTQRPKAKHDDIPDAIEQAVGMVRKFVPAADGARDDDARDRRSRKSVWDEGVDRSRKPEDGSLGMEESPEEVHAGVIEGARRGFFGLRRFGR